MIDTAQFVLIVITAVVGMLAWFGARRASREASQIAERVATHTKELANHNERIAEVQERVEQRGHLAEEKRRTQARKQLRATLFGLETWLGDLPESPKESAWRHEPRTDAELLSIEELVTDSEYVDSDVDFPSQTVQLQTAVRELNSAIAVAKDRQQTSVGRGYDQGEIDQWRRSRGAALRALKKLQSHLPE
jgi:hypothetical protein